MKKKNLVILILILLFIIAFSDLAATESPIFVKEPASYPTEPRYVPTEIIVRFKPDVRGEAIAEINQKHGTSVISTSRFAGFKRLRIPPEKTVAEMVEAYRQDSNVEYAEPNYIRHALMVPNDTYYRYQWHFDDDHTNNPGGATQNPYGGANGGGIRMEPAWDTDTAPPLYGGDPGIIVAVVDTGVAYEDYGTKYKKAPDLANTNFVAGYDFVNNDTHPNDDNSHGTHVSGTVAQSTNNNLGVAGIAFNTSIMPVKVLDKNGNGTDADVADGIYFATNNGAKLINLSLGGSSSSTTLENAVAYAYNSGVTVLAAAGNKYQEGNPPSYPAAYNAYVIAVGATRYDEIRAYYSNTGSYVDIAAPGGDVNVDQNQDGYGDGVLQQTFNPTSKNAKDFAYYFFQGTSMATPHVVGVAALLLAQNPTWTPDQVRNRLQSTAEDKGTAGWDPEYGWGLLDAYTALTGGVSISIITDGNIPFGTQALGAVIDTTSTGTNDVQIVRVDSGPANLNIRSSVFSDGTNTWSLSSTNGDNQVKWEFQPGGGSWNLFGAANTLYPLASNLTTGQTKDVYFRLTMPTVTASSNQYGATVTIVAVSP